MLCPVGFLKDVSMSAAFRASCISLRCSSSPTDVKKLRKLQFLAYYSECTNGIVWFRNISKIHSTHVNIILFRPISDVC